MSKSAQSTQPSAEHADLAFDAAAGPDAGTERARPIPRVSIQAFCEMSATAEVIQIAAEDRRLAKAHVSVHMGGAPAAVAHYREHPTPNLIVIESVMSRAEMLAELDLLAESCDAGTKVIIIGHVNDVVLYRELLKRGVSEYLIAPITPIQFMASLSNIYNSPDAAPVGQVIAFVGAKGGVGSSTICHNTAWALSELLKTDVVIADLDLPFGTAGLNFDKDPVQGIADAIGSPERLDEMLLDRLLTKCSEHLSLFAAPGMLDREWDVSADSCELVLDVVRHNVPYVAVDLPHVWTSWSKRVLLSADDVVITTAPDIANLRNAKNIIDLLKQGRHNDRPPYLVVNMLNTPKRPEIPVADLAKALDLQPSAVLEFDAETFGQAANNGQMIEELTAKAKAVGQFRDLALLLAGRQPIRVEKKSALGPFLQKLKIKR
jgi:pilus assembly protein CpaE